MFEILRPPFLGISSCDYQPRLLPPQHFFSECEAVIRKGLELQDQQQGWKSARREQAQTAG